MAGRILIFVSGCARSPEIFRRESERGSHYTIVPTLRAISLLLSVVVTLSAETGVGARYIGGTVSAIPADSNGRIRTTDDLFFNFVSSHRDVSVGYDKINLLEYGQNVNRRLGLAITI